MDRLSCAVSQLDLQHRPAVSVGALDTITARNPDLISRDALDSPALPGMDRPGSCGLVTPNSTNTTTPMTDSPDEPYTTASSSNPTPSITPPAALAISADVQARIMAFQQKRQNRPLDKNMDMDINHFNKNTASAPDLTQLISSSTSSPPAPSILPSPPAFTLGSTISSASDSGFPTLNKGSLAARRGIRLTTSLSEPVSTTTTTVSSTSILKSLSTLPSTSTIPVNSGSSISSSLSSRRKNLPGKLPSSLGTLPETGPLPTGTKFNTNLFNDYSRYIDIKTGTLNFAGKASLHSQGINFDSGTNFNISLDQLEPLGELGKGNYGTVTKVLHKPTNVIMAMKEIRLELEESKFTQIIMELDILHKCNSPYIVDFYGAFFVEGAVYVCMEYMDGGSLDKIYEGGVEEPVLAKITSSVVRALQDLKDNHNIIHRDVKPTNILIASSGKVKMCDFGVSGNLVASIAKTNIGCQSYMAPERIKSINPSDAITYTAQSDIWSLGLSLLEVAMGCYPYPPETYDNIFSQLSAIVNGEPPTLPRDRFSEDAIAFVSDCLQKIPKKRPTYAKLLMSSWLKRWDSEEVDMAAFVQRVIEKRDRDDSDVKIKPALHLGGGVSELQSLSSEL